MKSTIQKTSLNIMTIILPIAFIAFSYISIVQAGPPWEQIHKFLAADGAAGDFFGASVAIDGNIAVVGASADDNDNGIDSGAAYVYDITTGAQLFKLLASDGSRADNFGSSVAVSGDLALIGASRDDENGGNSGAAYIFDVTTGQQISKLLASDGVEGDNFGCSVAISGNLAVIGASAGDDASGQSPGSAYIFDLSTGQQLFKLLASDGRGRDYFGFSVGISGNLAVIGAYGNDDKGDFSGSAYVFDVTTGQQRFKILAPDGSAFDHFGQSVAISGDLALIGSFGNNDNGIESGSAYVFDVNTRRPLLKLLASDETAGSKFGSSVAINGNLAVIGAMGGKGNKLNSGSAYLFDMTTGVQLLKMVAMDGVGGDAFGYSVALSGNLVLTGAFQDGDNGSDSGSAYVFQRRTTNALTVSPLPLVSGRNGTFSIIQALPIEKTWLLYSLDGVGNTYLRKLNVLIDLSKPKLAVGPKRTDANGDVQFMLRLPTISTPVDIWFQAVQQANVTNFVPTQVIP